MSQLVKRLCTNQARARARARAPVIVLHLSSQRIFGSFLVLYFDCLVLRGPPPFGLGPLLLPV